MQNLIDDIEAAVADTALAPLVAELAARDDVPTFTPRGPWKRDISRKLLDLSPWQVLPNLDKESAGAVISALLLWNDDLHESHEFSQDLPSQTGSYLHGIMHRREPDYGNGGYWFRRVGPHPMFGDLLETVKDLDADGVTSLGDGNGWDPFAMIDACRQAEREPNSAFGLRLREIQLAELLLLTRYCLAGGVA